MNKILVVILLLHVGFFKSQTNLVANGGFELNSSCPSFGAQWNLCTGWNNVNLNTGVGFWGTPDYFHACGSGGVVPPSTFAGTCSPHLGGAMMALVVYNIPYPNYREYLSTLLTCSMIPGNTYTVSFWLSNGTGVISPWTISNIGIHFSSSPLTQIGFGLINVIPQCEITNNVISNGWTQYSFTVNPTANWNRLTIGAFRDDASNNVTLSYPNLGGPPSSYANYFVDDIQVLGSAGPNVTSSSGNFSICAGQSLTLYANGANTYTWSNSSNSSSIVVSPQQTTTYTITGLTPCGSGQTQVTVYLGGVAPSITISGSPTVCAGNISILNASGAGSYTWNIGSIGMVLVATPTISTTYSVIGTSTIAGCTGTASASFVVNPVSLPTLNVTGPLFVCYAQAANFNISGASSYSWSTGANGSSTTIYPLANTVYTVTGSNPNGCQSSLAFTLNVKECVGINELNENLSVHLGPNPVDETLEINLGATSPQFDKVDVTILNTFGEVIKTRNGGELDRCENQNVRRLNMSEFSKGLYTIRIQINDQFFTKLIFKE